MATEKKCCFCESYELWRNIHEFDNTLGPKDEKTKHEYSVALVIRSWKPKYRTKRHAGRVVDYRNQGIGYKLNFCPECGKRLVGNGKRFKLLSQKEEEKKRQTTETQGQ